MTHEQKIEMLRTATNLADSAGRLNSGINSGTDIVRSKIVDLSDLVKSLSDKSKEILKKIEI